MIDRQMDGLILVAPRVAPGELEKTADTVPTVAIGPHLPEAANFDTVNNDDELGGQLAVRHLHEAGYRNIVLFSLELSVAYGGATVARRETGYGSAMRELGVSRYIRIVTAPQTDRDIQLSTRHLLQSQQRPEAIFCWTDFVALQVLSVAHELGLSVPGDLAVVGYDNTSYCDLAQNALTSIDQSGQVLGLQAARLLIERIKGRTTAEHLVVTPRLVARASSSARSA